MRDAGLAEEKTAIAYVCRQHRPIREVLLADRGDAAPLDRLLSALADDTPPATPLRDLHQALLQAGDAMGVYGGTREGTGVLGLLPPLAGKNIFLCPRRRRCTRFHWAEDEPNGPPACGIDRTPMLLKRT
ncbi:hypothetical protein ACFV0C_17160 [Streptomyces sp. NPDC059568]|uniref:hypothetical protein n=1 Tax=Streptomyces sp. NPDC059568 TaxID=3346868 RepID=UPI00368CC162